MNTTLMVIQGLLTFVFLLAGVMKLAQTKEKVISGGGKWAEDFQPKTIKLIGAGEVLCAIGIYIPQLLHCPHAGLISMISAGGICAFMGGAFVTHIRRKETPFLVVTGVFFLLSAFVIYANCISCHTTPAV